ncbi:MAG TPA: MFS transporter, partial [Polyangiaceae bacterium LLY-WYZ-15_(1-7)]|nr:MFS transporter [Polyangiaceae bacterium LLY-WYZ-15_(1-7)]
LLGIAGASFGVAMSLGSGWYPPKYKGLAMGLVGAGNVGTAVSVLVAPPLAQWLGWQSVYAIAAAAITVPMLVMVVFAKEPPDVDTHFAAGPVSVVFLEDELRLDGDRLVRAQPMGVAEPVATYRTAAYCLLVDAEGARRIDEATYRNLVADAEDHDLFLDLLSTVAAGRYRACRRDDGGFHEDSLTHQQAWAYAELMERRQPLRAGELEVLNSYGSPDKQVEAARRVLDVKVSRYEWRATKLLRGDDRRAKRYLFQPPGGLRWALLKPLEDRA